VIDTRTPILYLDVELEPGASFVQPIPRDDNVFAYVVEGQGEFGEERRRARRHEMVTFGKDGDAVRIAAPSGSKLKALVIGGAPLNEPVARYGPFVMNTREEIVQAFADYQSGRLGEIR
jgi:redox-sensitive bicupin YhaK (pirin superfamily)